MKYVGFTLAEVLITLSIIGIVAAMTLPSVITNSRNKQLEAGLKKSYSVISQALEMYRAENGEPLKAGESIKIKPILMKYLLSVKDCGTGSFDPSACIPNYGVDNENNSTVYKIFNGKRLMSLQEFDDGQFVLNDGTLILLENMVGASSPLFISVDVNGYNKNPNRLGQDLFMFQIDNEGRLLPMGVEGTKYYNQNGAYCSASSSNRMNGAGCTYNALNDKDYFKNLPK